MKFCFCTALLLILLTACEREQRPFQVSPPDAERIRAKSVSNLYAGPREPPPATSNEYEENAYALSEGKRLFTTFNCVGCHSHGGGGIGPPLMDSQWIYGDRPEQIFGTIVEGRPNGMPSFRGKIPDHQVWQLAAYVRSMSGLVPKDAAPGRNDDLWSGDPENSRPPVKHED